MATRSKAHREAGVCASGKHIWVDGQETCKLCRRKSNRKWDENSRERRRAIGRKSSAKYYKENPDKCLASVKRWQSENPGKVLEATRKWKKAHPEYNQNRRALEFDADVGDVPVNYVEQLIGFQGGRCVYCHKKEEHLTVEHVIPLSRGGLHGWDNLALACQPCNSSKGSKLVEEWNGLY